MQTPTHNDAVIHFFGWESWPATATVAAVPLITRALICCSRAGIDHFFLWGDPQSAITEALVNDPRIGDCWQWLPQANELGGEGRVLVYGLHTLIAPQTLQNFITTATTATTGLALFNDKISTRIAMIDRNQLRRCPCQSQAFDQLLADLPTCVASGFVYPVRGPKKQVELALLDSLQSPLEGQVDVYFNRPLGRLLTPVLVKWRVHPNIVSLASIGVGLLAAVLFLDCRYYQAIIGALCLQLSAVLDCIDGDVARLQFKESRLGRWLDISGDNVVHLAVFVALGIREYWQQQTSAPIILGGLLALGTVASFILVVYSQNHLRYPGRNVELSSSLTQLHRFIDRMTSRDFTVLLLFAAIIGNLSWFLWVAAIGIQIFWLLLLIWVITVRHKMKAAE